MIYFSPTVRALESQIAYLKERVARLEQENRDLRDLQAAATAAQSQAHVDTLKSVVDDARLRANGLLDRVLERNNIAPVTEPPKPAAEPEVLTPYSAMGPEYQEAYKASFLTEEAAWLMHNDPMLDEGTARGLAEQEYLNRYQPIR